MHRSFQNNHNKCCCMRAEIGARKINNAKKKKQKSRVKIIKLIKVLKLMK